jgi:hypothetical protein
MKIGGYVKADFIYDFDPIDATDSFNTTRIPVGADPRTSARYHARQTRLSGDTRWTANERVVRDFTYAENRLDNTAAQAPDDVHRTTYLAANLIWNPLERVRVGVEYLYGLREDLDRGAGSANRVQVAFIFDLP